MDTRIVTANYRLKAWSDIIRRRTESGLTVKDWCLQNNVSRDQYFYWLRKVKAAAVRYAGGPEFAEITPPYSCAALPEAEAAFRVGDVLVLVNSGTPDELMVRALKAARHAQ